MIGIIGGSGLYEMDGLKGAWQSMDTPWGAPSDQLFVGTLGGSDVVFVPRHGRGHRLTPSEINYRANIHAMKALGVSQILSVSACGSFRETMAPGDFVLVDQFIDRTLARPQSFFTTGCVAHVSMAHPTCARLGDHLARAADLAGITCHQGGTYLAMEGPQFSTMAESHMYRNVLGADVIGMTNMPEARLAREAEICYATIAMVTDYDSWHPNHGAVDIRAILEVATANRAKACTLLDQAIPLLARETAHPCPHGCTRALEYALVTAPQMRDRALLAKLSVIAGRVLAKAT